MSAGDHGDDFPRRKPSPKNKAKAPAQPPPKAAPAKAEKPLADNEIIVRNKTGLQWVLELVPPASMSLRYEVTYMIAESEARAVMAALGLCSRRVQHNVPYMPSINLHTYGQQVMDWMLLQDVAYLDALNAGRMAWRVLSQGLLSAREVDEAEGFIDPGEESTS